VNIGVRATLPQPVLTRFPHETKHAQPSLLDPQNHQNAIQSQLLFHDVEETYLIVRRKLGTTVIIRRRLCIEREVERLGGIS